MYALISARAARALDEDLPPLSAELRARGIDHEVVDWDDPAVDWSRFELALLRSPWDYVDRYPEFCDWIARAAACTRLLNPPEVLRWNLHKGYLLELAARAVPIVPTTLLRAGAPAQLPEHGELVVKPAVGAGSRDARRFRDDPDGARAHAQALLAAGRDVLVQPYLARVDAAGETALMHFAGEYLRDKLGCDLDPGANWEVAFEACFYRDLWYHGGRKGELYSPKRTFDLALFSDDAIVVIEAKAQQAFDSEQLQTFCADREAIRAVTDGCEVLLVGLCSSKHEPSDEAEQCFDGKIVTWAALAEHFGNDVDLQRADHIYEPGAFSSFGQNNAGGHMSGAELLAAFRRGERFLVGRAKGGLDGPLLAEDVATGRWKTQKYETNSDEEEPPNRNWFWLADFAVRVTQAGHRGNAGDEAARRG